MRTLGLPAQAPPGDPLLRALLRILKRWCRVRYAEVEDQVDAWLVTDASDPSEIATDVPVLIWTRDPLGPAALCWAEVGTLVAPSTSDGCPPLAIPDPGVDATQIPWVAPHVRARWRRRLDLPQGLVVRPGTVELPEHLRSTALAVGAVGVVSGDTVLSLMAWGLPVVTDAGTERRLGLDGAVAVADGVDSVGAAQELAMDEPRMSTLSWRARRLVETRYDLATAAHRVAVAGSLQELVDPSSGVLTELSALWSSPGTARAMVGRITT